MSIRIMMYIAVCLLVLLFIFLVSVLFLNFEYGTIKYYLEQ